MRETNLGGGGKGRRYRRYLVMRKCMWVGVFPTTALVPFSGVFSDWMDLCYAGEERVRGGGDGSMEMK